MNVNRDPFGLQSKANMALRQFMRGTGLLLVVHTAIARIAWLIAVVVLSRDLEGKDFGLFSIVHAMSVPVAQLATKGFPLLISRAAAIYSTEKLKLSDIAGVTSLRVRKAWIIIACIATISTPLILVSRLAPELAITGLLAAIGSSSLLNSAFLNGVSRSGDVARLSLLKQVVFLFLVLASTSLKNSAMVGLSILVLTELGYAISLGRLKSGLIGSPPSPNAWQALIVEKDAAKSLASTIVTGFATWALPAAIALRGSLDQTAGFSICQRWAQLPLFATSAISPALLPTMVKVQNGSPTRRKEFGQLLLIFYLATCVAPTIALLIFSDLVLTVSGTNYAAFASSLSLMSIAAMLSSLNSLLGPWVIARKRLTLWLASDVVLAAVVFSGIAIMWSSISAKNGASILLCAYGASLVVLLAPTACRSFLPRR